MTNLADAIALVATYSKHLKSATKPLSRDYWCKLYTMAPNILRGYYAL